MTAYFLTVGPDNRVHHLYADDYGNVPGDAIPVTGAQAEIIRLSPRHGEYLLVNGELVHDPVTASRRGRITEIERARDAACCAGVIALGRVWQADKRSQELLGQAITLAQAGLPLPAAWRDNDNGDMPVTSLADLLAIAGAMAAQTQAAYASSWARKAAILAAATVAEVEAVTW